MRKYIYIGVLILFSASRAPAQFTLVTGTVTDVNNLPYACATITATLINNNGVSATLNGAVISGFTSPVKLGCIGDSTTLPTQGAFQMQLPDNTLVKCGVSACGIQTQWQFTVNGPNNLPPLGTGPQTCTVTLTISGASQAITTSLNSCPALTRLGTATGVGGGAGVASFSYSQVGMDQLDLGTVTNPTTTPQLTLTAQSTQPGFALMGPVPSAGVNPSFETSNANSNASSTTPTIGVTPAVSASAAIFAVVCANSTHAAAPTPGTWSTIDNTNWVNGSLYASNLSSTSALAISTSCGAATTWVDSIGIFGGSFSSVPHNSTLSTNCGNACNSGTLGPLTSGNLVLIVAEWSSGTVNLGATASVTDSAGNQYIKVANAFQPSASGVGHLFFVAQFVAAGTPTITVTANNPNSIVNFGNVRAYEISGLTSYFSGPAGPWTFRQITQADIGGTQILWSNLIPGTGTNTSSGHFVQQNGNFDFTASSAFEIPASAGAAPTADGGIANNTTTHSLNFGSNGITVNAAAASTGAAGTGTTCGVGTAITSISTTVAPTCANPAATTNQVFTNRNLAANVSVTANTTTNIDSFTLAALPAACATNACRLRISYSYYISGGVNTVCWLTDGTALSRPSQGSVISNNFAFCQDNTILPAQYSSGATPTITVKINGTGAMTVCTQVNGASPCNSGNAINPGVTLNSNLQLEVIVSQ